MNEPTPKSDRGLVMLGTKMLLPVSMERVA